MPFAYWFQMHNGGKSHFRKNRSTSPFPSVNSLAPLTAGFKEEPNQRKPGILTNYTACQPCCCGSIKHFCRRFQLQKFYSDSSEHFQGYPMLAKRKRSIQAECQSHDMWHNIRPSGSTTWGEKSFIKHFTWKTYFLYTLTFHQARRSNMFKV